jgi:hypothetical protein
MPRVYTASFKNVTISAAQDLISSRARPARSASSGGRGSR